MPFASKKADSDTVRYKVYHIKVARLLDRSKKKKYKLCHRVKFSGSNVLHNGMSEKFGSFILKSVKKISTG